MQKLCWMLKLGLVLCVTVLLSGTPRLSSGESDGYGQYVKAVEGILGEFDKVNFALESGSDTKKLNDSLVFVVDKKIHDENNLNALRAGIQRPMMSDTLLGQGLVHYNKLLTVLTKTKGGKEMSKIARYLKTAANGFVEMTRIALKKDESITIKDCPLCKGTLAIDCYYCPAENKGICPGCKGSGCSTCDKIGSCPVCTGSGKVFCPVCSVITRGVASPDEMEIMVNELVTILRLDKLQAIQTDWQKQDKDGNKKRDYWTFDVSCLFRMLQANGTTPVETIEKELARADGAPAKNDAFGEVKILTWEQAAFTPVPRSGYLFRTMTKDFKGNNYNQNVVGNVTATNDRGYAFIAYPAVYGKTGTKTFIVNQTGKTYSTDCGGEDKKIVLQWPADPVRSKSPKATAHTFGWGLLTGRIIRPRSKDRAAGIGKSSSNRTPLPFVCCLSVKKVSSTPFSRGRECYTHP